MVCYLINPLSMNQKANLNCDILSRSLNSTRNAIHYADYDEYEAFLNDTQPQYEIPGAHDGEIILLRRVFIMNFRNNIFRASVMSTTFRGFHIFRSATLATSMLVSDVGVTNITLSLACGT